MDSLYYTIGDEENLWIHGGNYWAVHMKVMARTVSPIEKICTKNATWDSMKPMGSNKKIELTMIFACPEMVQWYEVCESYSSTTSTWSLRIIIFFNYTCNTQKTSSQITLWYMIQTYLIFEQKRASPLHLHDSF